MVSPKIKNAVLVILVFVLALFLSRNLLKLLELDAGYLVKILHAYSWYFFPAVIVSGLLFEFKNIWSNLGLGRGLLNGLAWGLIIALPMMLGSCFTGTISENLSFVEVFRISLGAGFIEEFFFRGFLFGLLFRKCGWGFIPAALLCGLVFGALHIYQGESFAQALAISAITAVGGVWFAWLYIEWDENLWLPIFLHTFMNLSWAVFDISDSGALGGYSANTFRIATIALSVFLTIRLCKKRDRFNINRTNLLLNSDIQRPSEDESEVEDLSLIHI